MATDDPMAEVGLLSAKLFKCGVEMNLYFVSQAGLGIGMNVQWAVVVLLDSAALCSKYYGCSALECCVSSSFSVITSGWCR
jgi:hypothetical protein